ncbi:meiosis 1 arrest protein [Anguilla rostrata]|uniref:meiosis 1 arrest protein n=1 Tax=Anguilla rostrata TaxID=7938 RepID=UPI0030D17CE4
MSFRNKPRGVAAACSSSFSRQPPRVLVVDTAPPWWREVCHSVCEALDGFLTLASSLDGPCRLPLLSLYAVSSHTECLLPLAQVKGNVQRLRSCVEELRSAPREGCVGARDSLLQEAVQDSLLQFKQYLRHVTVRGPISSSSAEVTVLTSRPAGGVVRQLEAGLKDTDLVSLRRLVVVCIARDNDAPSNSPETPLPAGLDPEDSLVLGREVELLQVENDTVALETVFKGWLHDLGGDREHLHLLLPPSLQGPGSAPRHTPSPAPGHTPSASPAHDASSVCLKCDVQERLLSPALFACTPDLGPNTETVCDFHPPTKGPTNQSAPPHRLTIIKALRADGVCESVLYGLPLIIKPTNCWQLDWDEMEANHQLFHALCHTLRSQGWFLLARCASVSSRGAGVGGAGAVGGALCSYAVLQPSASLSLLLKPVAARELLLPCALSVPSADPPHSALTRIQSSLAQLEEDPVFNPLCLRTNLYPHLRSLQARSPYPCRTQQRRDTHCPAEGTATPQHGRQSQARARATVAPLPLKRPARPPIPPLPMTCCTPSLCSAQDLLHPAPLL